MRNPSVSKRQQRFMCVEYGRAKRGKQTQTRMSTSKLREFCMTRKRNPHLETPHGKWAFVGFFHGSIAKEALFSLKAHHVDAMLTKNKARKNKNARHFKELYVAKRDVHLAMEIIRRLDYDQMEL